MNIYSYVVSKIISNPKICRKVLLLGGIAVIPLMVIASLRLSLNIKIPDMTRDVAAIGGIHPLSGFLSSLGILFWWTSSSIWFFSAIIKRQINSDANIKFQIYSGLLSLYLALDDLFQFHEHIAPNHLKLPELVIYLIFLFLISSYVWNFKDILMKNEALLAKISIFFLAGSVFVDISLEGFLLWTIKNWSYLIEDGLKWLGIFYWAAFSVEYCIFDLKHTIDLKNKL